MRTPLITLVLASLFVFTGAKNLYAQSFQNQFAITSDNDQYIDPNHDRYYSDATIFNLTHALNRAKTTDGGLVKEVLELSFGQKIYTAQNGHIYPPYHIDRPFTGYLFAGAALNWLYSNEDALKINAEIGTIGPAALGEEIQSGFHKLFGLYHVVDGTSFYKKYGGWSHQLNGEPGLNLRLDYKHIVARGGNWFDMAFNPEVWLGNTFTGASAGMQFRLGNAEKLFQSANTNSRVTASAGEHANTELYFFTTPQINYVVYDATIQGALFRSDKGPITFGIYHWVYQQQFGIQYASTRWSANFIAFIRSREVKSTALGDQWGSINLAYRFSKI